MSGETFLPWWSCSAMILDGCDEIDADLEVRRVEEKCMIVPAVAASSRECGGIRQSECRHEWAESGFAGHSHWCQRCLLPGRRAGR